jgi:hypothetical protein
MMEVVKKTCFAFSITVDGVTYNFTQFTEDEAAARKQLIGSLQKIIAELEAAKAGSKSN